MFVTRSWQASNGVKALSPFMNAVYQIIQQDMKKHEDHVACILSIETYSEQGLKCSNCLFTIGLPEGLIVEIEYCAYTAEALFDGQEVTDVEGASDFVIDVIESLRHRGYENIVNAVHQERITVRKTFAGWLQNDGIAAHLQSTKLLWTEHERYTGALPHVMSVSCLGEDLKPTIFYLEHDLGFETTKELKKLYSDLSRRRTSHSSLGSQGADGTIDMLALHALKAKGAVEPALRNWECLAFGSSTYDTHKYKLGHISIDKTVHAKPRVRFLENSVLVHGIHLPETALLRYVGKPVTSLISLCYLSLEMTVTNVSNLGDADHKYVLIEFDQPTYHFCSLSGRYWR